MKIIVTGGAGFIGAHSGRLLLSRSHEVHAVDDLSHGKREAVPAGATLHVVDVRSPAFIQLAQQLKPDAVLHLAAQMDVRKSVADPADDASINILGTVNALEAARRSGSRRFILASSGGAVYGEQDQFPCTELHPRRPASPYGASKLCGEEYLLLWTRLYGFSTLALRYANVYGPGQDPMGEAGVVAIFAGKMLKGETPTINGDGLQTRDYVYVEDVAMANALALESQVTGALNVGTGLETNVVEIAKGLAAALKLSQPSKHGPTAPGEQRRSVIDPAAIGKALGWRPTVQLADGLARTAQWFAKK
ncbi:MAG TPA: NAD-dependent epimerase/dehydratase family protein [Myxococcales bacterium]|nr:NAD-dependent epimerase/dehydratase family protein [Myxococcales bacterium]